MDLTEVPAGTFRRHPWETARARFFRRVLADAGLLAAPRAVLDVGAGDGFVARTLLATLPVGSEVVCYDTNYQDADLRRFASPGQTGLSFVRERPTRRFELILLLDVIEHVADDVGFLLSFVTENLAPGGSVLVSVPAWQALYSGHDEALAHFRRYSHRGGRALLAAAGLEVRREGGLFHSLVAPRALAAAREGLLARMGRKPPPPDNVGRWRGGPALTALVGAALAADNAVSHGLARAGVALPGLSFWAVAAPHGAASPGTASHGSASAEGAAS
jgi:SAM-dependent methyltransferase